MDDEGYIYVLSNEAFKSTLFKIGKTERTPQRRARELSTKTGVPADYVVEYTERVRDCHLAETIVHQKLARYRISGRKEFFRTDLKYVVKAVQEAADEVGRIVHDVQPLPGDVGRASTLGTADSETDVIPPKGKTKADSGRSLSQLLQLRFWTELLREIGQETSRFQHVRPPA